MEDDPMPKRTNGPLTGRMKMGFWALGILWSVVVFALSLKNIDGIKVEMANEVYVQFR